MTTGPAPPPCGRRFLLFGTPTTPVGRPLATRPLIGAGLLSYSAYLWHQPLFAFARIRTLSEPPPAVMLGLGAGAFVLAYFSWRFVETPFRRGGAPAVFRSRSTAVASFVIVAAGLVAFGIAGTATGGLPSRFTQAQLALLAAAEFDFARAYREGECFLDEEQSYDAFAADCTGGQHAPLIWGDSHAAALSYGLHLIGGR